MDRSTRVKRRDRKEQTVIEAMTETALSLLQDGKRCDCVNFSTRYNKGARQSKPMIEVMRRRLPDVRTHLRSGDVKNKVLLTPVSELFHKNGYDKIQELDEDQIKKSLPHKGHKTYELVLSEKFPQLAIAHANSLSKKGEGMHEERVKENTLLVEQKIANPNQLYISVFKIDQAAHLEIFGVRLFRSFH